MVTVPQHERDEFELRRLTKQLKLHNFFRTRKLTPDAFTQFLLKMYPMSFQRGQNVCEIGDEGDSFYFILKGVTEVRIPDFLHNKQYNSVNRQLPELKKQISDLSKQTKKVEAIMARQIMELIGNTLQKKQELFFMPDIKEKVRINFKKSRVKFTQLSTKLSQLESEYKSLLKRKNFELMIPVAHLGPGKWFGELALRVDEKKTFKRNATVVCMEDCLFACLAKADYQQIVGDMDRQH